MAEAESEMPALGASQMTADDLRTALVVSLYQDALRGERSDDRTVSLARLARGFPTDVVDEAFAAALPMAMEKVKRDQNLLNDILVLAHQFADRAGADRFSTRTRRTLEMLLNNGKLSPPGVYTLAVSPLGRAHALALARAVGVSITVERLSQERSLKRAQPLLWLDLARDDIAGAEFLLDVRDGLLKGMFHPFALVPRLKAIVLHQGIGIAQRVLDTACHILFDKGQFSDAHDLIVRANSAEPRGWRMPMGEPLVPIVGIKTPADLVRAFEQSLLAVELPTVNILKTIEIFRPALDPLLAVIKDDTEEARRRASRRSLFRAISTSPNFATIQVTGLLPDFRHPDALGFDWWQ
jgi:hypothetical protein